MVLSGNRFPQKNPWTHSLSQPLYLPLSNRPQSADQHSGILSNTNTVIWYFFISLIFRNNPFIIITKDHVKYFRGQIISQIYINHMITFHVFSAMLFCKAMSFPHHIFTGKLNYISVRFHPLIFSHFPACENIFGLYDSIISPHREHLKSVGIYSQELKVATFS